MADDRHEAAERVRAWLNEPFNLDAPLAPRAADVQAVLSSLSAAQAEIERLRGCVGVLEACLRCDDESVRTAWAREAEWKDRVAALEAGRDEIAKMLRSELVGRTHGAYDRGVRAGLNSALAALSPEASHGS
jgi:hypothetical protein